MKTARTYICIKEELVKRGRPGWWQFWKRKVKSRGCLCPNCRMDRRRQEGQEGKTKNENTEMD